MNIIDALKSGKPIYRKCWSNKASITFDEVKKLAYEAVVADDWEVEEEEITITVTQFQKALDTALLSRQWIIPAPLVQDPAILHAYHRDVVAMFDDFVVKLKKELGL